MVRNAQVIPKLQFSATTLVALIRGFWSDDFKPHPPKGWEHFKPAHRNGWIRVHTSVGMMDGVPGALSSGGATTGVRSSSVMTQVIGEFVAIMIANICTRKGRTP